MKAVVAPFCLCAAFVLFAAGCSHVDPYVPDFGGPAPPLRASTRTTPETQAIISTAQTQLGKPYRWGGESPSAGYDCSGLMWWTFRRNGFRIPRVSWKQYSAGTFVERHDIRPADMVFFKVVTGKSMHVGLVTDRGTFIHAPKSGKRVMESRLDNPFWSEHYVGARRIIH